MMLVMVRGDGVREPSASSYEMIINSRGDYQHDNPVVTEPNRMHHNPIHAHPFPTRDLDQGKEGGG